MVELWTAPQPGRNPIVRLHDPLQVLQAFDELFVKPLVVVVSHQTGGWSARGRELRLQGLVVMLPVRGRVYSACFNLLSVFAHSLPQLLAVFVYKALDLLGGKPRELNVGFHSLPRGLALLRLREGLLLAAAPLRRCRRVLLELCPKRLRAVGDRDRTLPLRRGCAGHRLGAILCLNH